MRSCGGPCTTPAAPTRTCPAPTPRERRSLPLPTALAVPGRAWGVRDLAGYGQRLAFEVAGRIGSLSNYMEGGSSSSRLTWERSGFTPKDVDVAQIYDGFSASVIYGLESYGFCQEGEALDFIQDGRIELDGELPLNTFGGSLGTGRIHGLWHIIEGALQASGRAGSRQVKDANVSFVGASAPIVTGTTFIFVGEPY